MSSAPFTNDRDMASASPAAPGSPMEEAPPSVSKLAAYAGPAIPISALQVPLLAYIPTLYATRLGLPLGAIGAVFLIVRLADIAFDPLVGSLMDRGGGRFGRFRPWLAVAALPLAVAVLALFSPPADGGLTYLAIYLAACYAGHSICYLAHLSWGATLATGYAARSRVFAWWQAGYLVGAIVVLATPIVIEGILHGTSTQGVSAMGWLVAGLLPITIAVAILTVGEPRVAQPAVQPRVRDYLRLMVRPTIARLLMADLVIGTAIGMNSALFFFYFGFVKGRPMLDITVLLFLNLCGSLCGTPIWSYLTGRIGKHRAAAWAFFFYSVSLVVIAVMPGDRLVGGIVLFAAGLTLSAGPLLLRSMMADAGDEEYLRSGADKTGLISALFSGTNKLGLAIAPGITFLGLGLAGFNPTGANDTEALRALSLLYIACPALLGLLTAAIIVRHKLTAERHREICAELLSRSQG